MKQFYNYTKCKYKKVSPEETVERIKRILSENHIETEETWTDSGIDEICSVRITIKGSCVGQNGKGTNKSYALASGYAEFMERLQTGYLLPEKANKIYDLEYLPVDEVEKSGGTLLYDSLKAIRKKDVQFNFMPVDVQYYLDKWSFDNIDGKMAVIPYKKSKEDGGKKYYIPENILRAYYFTNGSCAGNSREEAMVQGMSEICERFATDYILSNELTAPVIPTEYYDSIPGINHSIAEIKKNDRYSIRIMDASCGMGLPVVAAALFDKKQGKIVLRFGAHPKFELAIERAITEILQGRQIDTMENTPYYDCRNDKYSSSLVNKFNFMKGAFGHFSSSMYGDKASWSLKLIEDVSDSIEGQLEYMEKLYKKLGWDLYIRDCSFLGFPSYHLLVPGISMVFNFGMERFVEKSRIFRARELIVNPKRATEEELQDLYKLLILKKNFVIENSYSFLAGISKYPKLCDIDMDAALMAALLDIHFGRYQQAADLLQGYCYDENRNITGIYPLQQLLVGEMKPELLATLRLLCPKGWAERAEEIIKDPLSCFDI